MQRHTPSFCWKIVLKLNCLAHNSNDTTIQWSANFKVCSWICNRNVVMWSWELWYGTILNGRDIFIKVVVRYLFFLVLFPLFSAMFLPSSQIKQAKSKKHASYAFWSNTASIRETMEQSNPWTNKQTNMLCGLHKLFLKSCKPHEKPKI